MSHNQEQPTQILAMLLVGATNISEHWSSSVVLDYKHFTFITLRAKSHHGAHDQGIARCVHLEDSLRICTSNPDARNCVLRKLHDCLPNIVLQKALISWIRSTFFGASSSGRAKRATRRTYERSDTSCTCVHLIHKMYVSE